MTLPSSETVRQIYAQGRNYINMGMGALVMFGTMTAGQSKTVMDGLNDIYTGLGQAFTGASHIWQVAAIVIGPIVGAYFAKKAGNAASTTSQAASIQQTAPAELASAMAKSPEVFVQAVKQMPTVQAVITTPDAPGAALAQNVPSTGVVQAGTPEAQQLAKSGS